MAPTQAERREATTTRLIEAGREQFARHGYAGTSLDAVVASAGVTKGALYHHFDSKRSLFRAVYEREQADQAEIVAAAQARVADPWAAFEEGCRAFLDHTLEGGVQRIVLIDAPGALGRDDIRAGEREPLLILCEGVRRAVAAGRIAERPAEPLAQLLFGALCEGAMTIARSDDQIACRDSIWAELRRMLAALET